MNMLKIDENFNGISKISKLSDEKFPKCWKYWTGKNLAKKEKREKTLRRKYFSFWLTFNQFLLDSTKHLHICVILALFFHFGFYSWGHSWLISKRSLWLLSNHQKPRRFLPTTPQWAGKPCGIVSLIASEQFAKNPPPGRIRQTFESEPEYGYLEMWIIGFW